MPVLFLLPTPHLPPSVKALDKLITQNQLILKPQVSYFTPTNSSPLSKASYLSYLISLLDYATLPSSFSSLQLPLSFALLTMHLHSCLLQTFSDSLSSLFPSFFSLGFWCLALSPPSYEIHREKALKNKWRAMVHSWWKVRHTHTHTGRDVPPHPHKMHPHTCQTSKLLAIPRDPTFIETSSSPMPRAAMETSGLQIRRFPIHSICWAQLCNGEWTELILEASIQGNPARSSNKFLIFTGYACLMFLTLCKAPWRGWIWIRRESICSANICGARM